MPIVVLNKIGVYSSAKIHAAIAASFGLIEGIIIALFSSVIPTSIEGTFGRSLGFGMIIFLPIVFGICGFIGGAIIAAVYNMVARWVGGVRMDMTEFEEDNRLE